MPLPYSTFLILLYSFGMKISRKWLEKYFNGELLSSQALAEALTFHAFEVEGIEKVGQDEVLDVKVTPNRGHDCLSHRGIAKELSAILNTPLISDPLQENADLSQKSKTVSIAIANEELCSRYIGGVIRGVQVKPSPKWLRDRLEAIGQRSINNVVDAINFVMFNVGQPLHVFDASKLKIEDKKIKIEVRNARPKEKMIALDGKEYELTDSMLVIADACADAPIGIAGVKGGMPAGITAHTKDIVIESATFAGPSIRKTAQALKLRTDASTRFEEVLSPELAAYGMHSAVQLILKLAGGEVEGFVDVYTSPQQPRRIEMGVSLVQELLSPSFTQAEVKRAFDHLGFIYEQKGEIFTVIPPFERLDLQIPHDLVEEVGRIIGYTDMYATPLPKLMQIPAINARFYWSEKMREFLVARGFSEIMTSVFAKRGEREVLNKIESDTPFLRDSLIPAMQEALQQNARNAEFLGLPDIRLFEIGVVFLKNEERLKLAIGVLENKKSPKPAAIVEEMASMFGAVPKSAEQNDIIEIDLQEWIEKLPLPQTYEDLPLSKTAGYKSFSKYPFIIRDVALWVPKEANEQEVLDLIRLNGDEYMVRSWLFDRFEKEEKVSLAFRLIFQSFERTLQDNEVNDIMEKMYLRLKEKGYEIR